MGLTNNLPIIPNRWKMFVDDHQSITLSNYNCIHVYNYAPESYLKSRADSYYEIDVSPLKGREILEVKSVRVIIPKTDSFSSY